MIALLAAAPGCGTDDGSLTVVSWGGSYARACVLGYYQPFTAETGIPISLEDYNGGLAQIRAQVDLGSVHWDVVDMNVADATRGCEEGLFEPIDTGDLAPSDGGESIEDDFYEGTISECGAGTLFYSTVVAYNETSVGASPPARLDDFFDLVAFPGRRGMRRTPEVNLEFALMASGVAPEDVYTVLSGPGGVERAFAKLDEIKDQVVWWEAGAQPPQMLADGEVLMTTAYNGRIFNAQVLERQPFTIIWDGQVLDLGMLVIVAGTPNLQQAKEFLRFSSRASSQAGVGRYIAYAPVRRSAEPLISVHAETGEEMAHHMPTHPDHMRRVLPFDASWWVDHKDEMNERFTAWLTR